MEYKTYYCDSDFFPLLLINSFISWTAKTFIPEFLSCLLSILNTPVLNMERLFPVPNSFVAVTIVVFLIRASIWVSKTIVYCEHIVSLLSPTWRIHRSPSFVCGLHYPGFTNIEVRVRNGSRALAAKLA